MWGGGGEWNWEAQRPIKDHRKKIPLPPKKKNKQQHASHQDHYWTYYKRLTANLKTAMPITIRGIVRKQKKKNSKGDERKKNLQSLKQKKKTNNDFQRT